MRHPEFSCPAGASAQIAVEMLSAELPKKAVRIRRALAVDSDSGQAQIDVAWKWARPALELDTAGLDLGSVGRGTRVERRLTLSNSGTADLVGQAIARVGCFCAGCCYGKPTDTPLGITFTSEYCNMTTGTPLHLPLHPTQLYLSATGIVLFIVLSLAGRKKKFDGQVLFWFMILHSTARLFIERFRGDDRGVVLNDWSMTQLITTLILIASVIMILILNSRHEKESK